jgi:tellurite resistance protein TerC
LWLGFLGFVLAMLALDLGVFHRQAHVVSVREALGWSAVWRPEQAEWSLISGELY